LVGWAWVSYSGFSGSAAAFLLKGTLSATGLGKKLPLASSSPAAQSGAFQTLRKGYIGEREKGELAATYSREEGGGRHEAKLACCCKALAKSIPFSFLLLSGPRASTERKNGLGL